MKKLPADHTYLSVAALAIREDPVSRPDTLKDLFEGKRELFRGLLIEDQWNRMVSYPIIKASGSISSPRM